jgi:hypothetical protein
MAYMKAAMHKHHELENSSSDESDDIVPNSKVGS